MVGLQLNIQKGERLAGQFYGQVLEKIVAGELKEGDKLPSENKISKAFQVSRPVIREALIQLAEPSDVAGLLRCFEARLPFEGTAAGLAAVRATPEDIKNIETTLIALEATIEGEGLADKADFNFHMAVAKATGNDIYVNILGSWNSAIKSGMQVALKITKGGTPDRIQRIRGEHRAIYDAIATGDAAAADLAMSYHIHRARTRVTEHMRDK